MRLVLVKVGDDLRGRIVDSRGVLLSRLLQREVEEGGFDRAHDVQSPVDYRDVSIQAEDEEHPLYQLFQGEPLVPGYDWTYGPPASFDAAATRRLHRLLEEADEGWPVSDIVEFLGRAVAEGRGVIVGVA